tara:strand:+ start:58599 stop:59594 length:996 start_codon:yes stop_codon:yes gene_type:complete
LKTAIVILNWNGKKLLEQFLPSIVAHSKDEATIYLADNASTDESVAFVKGEFPEVNIIKNKSNGGYAKGYNDALQHIEADIYCLINSDVEVTKNWLPPILNTFKKEPNTAIIQPKILDFKDKSKFEYAGAGGGFIDFFGYPYCRGRIFNYLETDEDQFNDISPIFWASGACFFMRRDVFHKLQGFDEDYFAHQEEIDLSWRTQNMGYDIKYVGLSTVYHVGGATLQESHPQKTFLNFRNSLLNVVKNIPKRYFLLVVLSRLILDGVAGVKFIVEFRPIHTWSILRAHFSFYRMLPKYLKRRRTIKKDKAYFKHFSVVWNHFVLRKKKFHQL